MYIYLRTPPKLGRDTAAMTRYGLTVWGSNPGGAGFSAPSSPALGPPSLVYNGHRISFLGEKRPGRGVDHPPRLAPRLKKA
jgi:hypothetical protein